MRVLVTAGATIERIDPIRYISNFSSGKQGYAIANTFKNAGHQVILISANCHLADIDDVKIIKIESAQQMLEATLANIDVDIFISVAAVCDWKMNHISTEKLKKQAGIDLLNLQLIKNPDILKTIANHTKRPKLVIGFAAETENLLENARIKLFEKNCDYIIANLANSVFGSEYNEAYLISKNAQIFWPKQTKEDIANKIIELIK